MKRLMLISLALVFAGCAEPPASSLPTAQARERAWRRGAVTREEREESRYQNKQAQLLNEEAMELAQRFQHPEKFPEKKKCFSCDSDDPENPRPTKENALLRMREGGLLIYGQPEEYVQALLGEPDYEIEPPTGGKPVAYPGPRAARYVHKGRIHSWYYFMDKNGLVVDFDDRGRAVLYTWWFEGDRYIVWPDLWQGSQIVNADPMQEQLLPWHWRESYVNSYSMGRAGAIPARPVTSQPSTFIPPAKE